MKVDHYLSPYTKINSKWIKDLKVRCETIKLLEEKIGSTLFDVSLRNIFLNTMSAWARATKELINKWDYITLKSFCTAKETINKMKKQLMEWEKIFANHIANNGLVLRIYKDSYNSIAKKPKQSI